MLFASAREQSDIFNLAPKPFLLESDLTVQLATPAQGHLTIQWQSKNHWRRELDFGPYKETVVRVGEWEYTQQKNVGFTPLRALQVVYLMEFARPDAHMTARSEKTRKRNGAVLTCVELESTSAFKQLEICTDPSTQEIISYNPFPYDIDGGSAEFSGYAGIEGMHFPTSLELRMGKTAVVTVNVTKLEEKPPDVSLLTPPQGAIERRYCEGATAPVMLEKPDIASLGVISGSVHLRFQVTVLKDGSVGSVQLIGQRSSNYAADIMRKLWMNARYKPAMCGTEPIVADVQAGLDIGQ